MRPRLRLLNFLSGGPRAPTRPRLRHSNFLPARSQRWMDGALRNCAPKAAPCVFPCGIPKDADGPLRNRVPQAAVCEFPASNRQDEDRPLRNHTAHPGYAFRITCASIPEDDDGPVKAHTPLGYAFRLSQKHPRAFFRLSLGFGIAFGKLSLGFARTLFSFS